ncbi:ribonuclease H-like domain-containing protein [Tanacetum coccineum]
MVRWIRGSAVRWHRKAPSGGSDMWSRVFMPINTPLIEIVNCASTKDNNIHFSSRVDWSRLPKSWEPWSIRVCFVFVLEFLRLIGSIRLCTSGKKKEVELSRQEVVEKGANFSVVSFAHGSLPVASGSPSTTLIEERINTLERKMLDEKLMLVDDDKKQLNKLDYALVNSDSNSNVEVAYDETAQLMASGGANDASLYEDEDYDIYDNYDIKEKGFLNGRGVKEKEKNGQHGLKSATLNTQQNEGTNIVNDDSFLALNRSRNSISESPNVVNDGKDSGPGTTLFVDPKVMEGVDEQVLPKSFTSLFTSKAVTSKAFFFFKFVSTEGMNGFLENGPWFIRSAPIILKKWIPNANLLKEDLKLVPIWIKIRDLPIVVFTTDELNVMATKLGNLIMLDSYTSSMCLQSWGRMDYARAVIDIRADRKLKEDMVIAIPNVEDDGEPKKPVWQALSKMNSVSSSSTKNNSKVSRKVTSSNNPFDALNTIEEGDELGSNGGSSNSGKLVLLDDEGKPEVEEVYYETTTYMALTSFNVKKASKSVNGGGNKSLYGQWKKSHGEDPYDDDDFDDPGLSDAQMKFANAFGINFRGQLR